MLGFVLLKGEFEGPEDRAGGSSGVDGVAAVRLAIGRDGLKLLEGCAAEFGVTAAGSRQVGGDAGAWNVADRGEICDP